MPGDQPPRPKHHPPEDGAAATLEPHGPGVSRVVPQRKTRVSRPQGAQSSSSPHLPVA